MLRLSKFQKWYGGNLALQVEDFSISPGIYWVRGQNGSGKSTLLKAVAGILPFKGEIFLNRSISLKKQPVSYRKLVNFADAEPVFPEFLTGRELIALFGSAKEAPAGQEDSYIQTMNMGAYITQPVREYSTGMLKKLSLVLAFMGDPALIVLDEPLITIDNASLQILYQWIADKNRLHGTGFLLSSHQALDQVALPMSGDILVHSQTLLSGE